MLPDNIVEAISRALTDAVDIAVMAVAKGAIQQEDHFSSGMLGAAEALFQVQSRDLPDLGVEVFARRLRDKGVGEEKVVGADILLTLSSRYPGNRFDKGVLIQVKTEKSMTEKRERERLRGQCERMEAVTDDGYVMIYSGNGVLISSAREVLELPDVQAKDLLSVPDGVAGAEAYFRSFTKCDFGDPKLGAVSRSSLVDQAERLRASHALRIKVGSPWRTVGRA